jgi:hypothetical protein
VTTCQPALTVQILASTGTESVMVDVNLATGEQVVTVHVLQPARPVMVAALSTVSSVLVTPTGTRDMAANAMMGTRGVGARKSGLCSATHDVRMGAMERPRRNAISA